MKSTIEAKTKKHLARIHQKSIIETIWSWLWETGQSSTLQDVEEDAQKNECVWGLEANDSNKKRCRSRPSKTGHAEDRLKFQRSKGSSNLCLQKKKKQQFTPTKSLRHKTDYTQSAQPLPKTPPIKKQPDVTQYRMDRLTTEGHFPLLSSHFFV